MAYFNHVSKARIAEVVTEAVNAEAAASLQTLKKDAAATRAEQIVAATGWLPTVMRLRDPAAESRVDVCEVEEGEAEDDHPGERQPGSGNEEQGAHGDAGTPLTGASGEHVADDDAPASGPKTEEGLVHRT